MIGEKVGLLSSAGIMSSVCSMEEWKCNQIVQMIGYFA